MNDGADMNLDGVSPLILLPMLCDKTVLLLNYNDIIPTVWFPPPCDEDFFEIVVYVGQANILKTLLEIGTDPDINIEQCGSMAIYFTLKKDDETVYKVLSIIFSYKARILELSADIVVREILPYLNPQSLNDKCILKRTVCQNLTKSANLLIENGADIGLVDPECEVLTCALFYNHCAVASNLVKKGAYLLPIISQFSYFALSNHCQDTTRLMLDQLTFRNISIDQMSVEIGDELNYNLLLDLDGEVVVINWQKLQWFTYILDHEARKLFEEKGNKDDTVSLVLVAPYPHPFFFMVDFRIILLNQCVSSPVEQDCQKVDSCQKVPDLFFQLCLTKSMMLYLLSICIHLSLSLW